MSDNITPRELEERRIHYAIQTLEDALARSNDEEMWTPQVYAALKLLERHVDRRTPLDEFCERLQNTGSENGQNSRWQTLTASLDQIKLAIARKGQVPR